VSVKDLAGRLAIEKTSWLRLRKRYLDPFAVHVDRERIEAFYRARGFFEARTVAAEVLPWKGPPESPQAVDVRFVIDEGPRTHITQVRLEGLAAVPSSHRLETRLHEELQVGEAFDHRRYLSAKRTLDDALQRSGYAWADVEGRVEVNRRAQEAQIRLVAEPGPLVRFGALRVEGEEQLSPGRIALHAGIAEGARFDPEQLEAARGRLFNLGMFSSVRIDYAPRPDDPTLADVIVQVRESTLNEVRLGVGLGLDFYRTDIHATASYTRRNWLGGLRTLTLRLEPAWVAVPALWDPQRNGPAGLVEAQLIQPDWPLPLGKLELAVGYDAGVEYAYQFHGPRASVGLQRGFWRDRVLLGASYNFQFLLFYDTDPVILDDPALAGRLFGYTNPYRIGWFQQHLALDLRDRPLDAHAGLYVSATFEEGGTYAGGAFQYEKILPELRAYAPLGRRVTLAGRFLFGQLFTQNDLGSPITRRFYLGGSNSHRGFNYDRLSPQVPSGQPGVSAIPIGGDQMVLVSAELRIDVVRLFGQWLVLAGFVDGGDVGGPGCGGSSSCARVSPRNTVDWTDLHWAAGGGLRYRTLVGSIRADLGVRLNRLAAVESDGTPNPDPGQRFAFHLSLGEAF
jgi:translocation and assembly module TamA